MAVKKYKLKNEVERFGDGSDNAEHIKDILTELEILFSNIQDNNDICMQIYQVRKQDGSDEDIVDAIQISCSNLLELEKQAGEIMQAVENYKDKLDIKCQEELKKLLKQMKNFEKQSRKMMESCLVS